MQRLIQFSLSDDDVFWLRFLLLRAATREPQVPRDTLCCLIRQLDCSARERIPAPRKSGDLTFVIPDHPGKSLEVGAGHSRR